MKATLFILASRSSSLAEATRGVESGGCRRDVANRDSDGVTIKEVGAMKPPIRVVCGDCLRSVEIQVDDAETLPIPLSTCPYCGGTIDSRPSEMGTQSRERDQPVAMGAIPGLSRLWTET